MTKQLFRLERVGEPSLRYAVWHPSGQPRGTILITQGYAESIERYDQVADSWFSAGFAVAAYDLRGQGLSAGKRGHVHRFADFTRDLEAVLAKLQAEHHWSDGSILFGHSLGALISTVAAIERPHAFRGLGLSSPFFGLALRPPAWKVFVGRKLTNIWPTYSERSHVDPELLTHDLSRVQAIRTDKLRVDTVTARWFTETEAARERVRRDFGRLTLPVYCQASAEDFVADVDVTRQVFATSMTPQHRLELVPGAYHELHQEVHREQYVQRFRSTFEQWV
jgi:alpha-beta hydrolase superfamily lysophospholipase